MIKISFDVDFRIFRDDDEDLKVELIKSEFTIK